MLAFAVSVPQTLFSAISEGTLAVIKSVVNGPRNNQINHFLRFKERTPRLFPLTMKDNTVLKSDV
jgi:DNA phosphorothioation-dependent restriction protein DptG